MMYNNRFVVCVLVNGQVQRELANGVVNLPFETDYGLRFRNKNDRRAVVKFYIDGENVSGNGYVIPANAYIDILRHNDKDRSFRFVSLDSPEAVDAGKNGPNPDKVKGLIEAHFFLEERPPVEVHHHHHYPPTPPWPYNRPPTRWRISQSTTVPISIDADPDENYRMLRCSAKSYNTASPNHELGFISTQNVDSSQPVNDGCTVEGNLTGQHFGKTFIKTEANATVIKIFLQGFEEKTPSKKAKSQYVTELEAENEELRKKIAEIENKQLQAELEKKNQQLKKKRTRKRTTSQKSTD